MKRRYGFQGVTTQKFYCRRKCGTPKSNNAVIPGKNKMSEPKVSTYKISTKLTDEKAKNLPVCQIKAKPERQEKTAYPEGLLFHRQKLIQEKCIRIRTKKQDEDTTAAVNLLDEKISGSSKKRALMRSEHSPSSNNIKSFKF